MDAFQNGPTPEQIDHAIINELPVSIIVNGTPVRLLIAEARPQGTMLALVGTVLHNEERIPCRLIIDPEHRTGLIHIA